MKKFILLVTLGLVFASCFDGSDDKGGGKDTNNKKEGAVDPWGNVGAATLPEESDAVTDTVRVLSFGDGMVISYDGSQPDDGESVCRRERVENNWYEICMPLEDDPFYIAQEASLVWHPLFFDRFATDLTCYTWEDGEGSKTDTDCEVVLTEFGSGEGVTCQAGLFNGDKALRCSDDWGVVVNGDIDDVKTVCRVHLESGSGRCLGAPREGIVDGDLILEMQRSSWAGYSSGQDNDRQFGAGETVSPSIPQDIPAGAVLEYVSRDEIVCRVDNDNSDGGIGTVSIGADLNLPVNCKIVLTIAADGFADRVLFAELPVLKANDTGWADYVLNNGVLYGGETVAAGVIASGDINPTTEFRSLDENICTVDERGTITAVAPGFCIVRLTSTAEDYLDAIVEKTVIVSDSLEFSDIVWNFPSAAVVGTDSSAIAAPVVTDANGGTVTDANLSVTIGQVSGDCSYNQGTRVLSFVDTTECVVSISASGIRGYREYVKEFRVTPSAGDMQLTWTGYAGGDTLFFGGAAPDLVAPTVVPADLAVDYTWSAIGGGCEVDPDTGALTVIGADIAGTRSCSVTLMATRQGYDSENIGLALNINKGSQTLLPPVSPYGAAASLKTEESLEILNPPVGGHGGLEYNIKSGACTVDQNRGLITATTDVTPCVVQAKWLGNDNYDPSPYADFPTVSIVSTSNTAPVWIDSPYVSDPAVGGNPVALVSNAISNIAAGTGAPEYRSKTPDACTVAGDGGVSGVSAGVDVCTVQARFRGDSTTGASEWIDSPSIDVDQGVHPGAGTDPYGASAQVKVGETLALASPLAADRGTPTFSVKSDSTSYCSVEESAGVITGLSVGNCTIQVSFRGSQNYQDYGIADMQVITIVPGEQVVNIPAEPYGANPTVKVGATLGLAENPSSLAGSNSGGDFSYRVNPSTSAMCTINNGDGEITGTSSGDCIIQLQVQATNDGNYRAGEWTDIATIAVTEGTLNGITWAANSGRAQVGTPLVLNAVNVGNTGAMVEYMVSSQGGTSCAFKEANLNDASAVRTLIFSSAGICVVTAQGSKENYATWEERHSVNVEPGELSVLPSVWGNLSGLSLVVNGASQMPDRVPLGESAIESVSTDYSGANQQGQCLQQDQTYGSCPVIRAPLTLADVSISYALARGERDCRLVNYRTGEVEALPVTIQDASQAGRIFTKKSAEAVFRFDAKTVGAGGNSILVTIEEGTTSGKKYTVSNGTITETRDNILIGGLGDAFANSQLVDVSILSGTSGEPDNAVGARLFGGATVAKAGRAFFTIGVEPVVEFVAKEMGDTGSAISVTIENGSNGNKKYTITDGSTTEIYDSVALADLEVDVQDSALIEVWILADLEAHGDIEPDNTAAINLLGGSERSDTTCGIVGHCGKRGIPAGEK